MAAIAVEMPEIGFETTSTMKENTANEGGERRGCVLAQLRGSFKRPDRSSTIQLRTVVSKNPEHGCPSDLQLLGDLVGPEAPGLQAQHFRGLGPCSRLPAFVFPGLLGLLDPIGPAFCKAITFELGNRSHHANQEHLRGVCGIEGMLRQVWQHPYHVGVAGPCDGFISGGEVTEGSIHLGGTDADAMIGPGGTGGLGQHPFELWPLSPCGSLLVEEASTIQSLQRCYLIFPTSGLYDPVNADPYISPFLQADPPVPMAHRDSITWIPILQF